MSLVARVNDGAAGAKPARFLILAKIRTHNLMADIEKQMTQPAHATATGSDQIDGAFQAGGLQEITHLNWSQWTHAICAV